MFEILLAVLLTSAILMAGFRRIKSLTLGFAIQSLMIAIFCFYLGFTTGETSSYLLGVLTILMKVVLTTIIIKKSSKDLKSNRETELIINGSWSYILCVTGIVFTYGILRDFEHPLLKAGVVLMIVGAILLIGRKKAISQMIGFLTMENGLVLFEISMIKMPLIIEAGIILEVLILALIMGVMIFHINRTFDSINTDYLSNLKG